MTEPTDDELDAVIAEYRTRIYPQDMHPRFERAIMRAAIAKWGTPPAVAGEPVGEFDQMRGRLVILAGAPMFEHRQKVYTTPQPTQAVPPAGREPLTPEQITAAAKKLAECMEYPWEFMPEPGRKNMRKHAQAVIEAAGGIQRKEAGNADT